MSYTMEWNGSDVFVTFGTKVEGEEILSIDDKIYGDSRLEYMRFQLFDFSQACDINLDVIDMKVIGTLDKKASRWNNHVKVAIITTDSRLKQLVRFYTKIMADTNWEVMLFSKKAEAVEWCNL